jgi:hypothetical protein
MRCSEKCFTLIVEEEKIHEAGESTVSDALSRAMSLNVPVIVDVDTDPKRF